MRRFRVLVSCATLVAHLSGVGRGSAFAAEGESSATADALFREGRAALARGDFAQAVAKLAESQRLEPATGTLINLAGAEEKLGKLSAAWEHARTALDQLPPGDNRRPPAQELFERLDGEIPRLTLVASSPLPPNAQVERDGLALGPASLGTALPADPGRHRIVVRVPGRADATYDVDLAMSASRTIALDVGPRALAREPRSTTTNTVGWIAIGAGVVGLGVGVVAGALALDRKHTVSTDCSGGFCGQDGLDAQKDGRTYATVSTVSFIAGLVLVAGGTVLVLLRPR